MNSVQIKNVIFDVGNVLVRWSPVEIVRLTFGGSVESEKMAQMLFSSQIWKDLNKGTISEREAKQRYQREHQVTTEEMDRFFYYVKHTQILLYGSIELLKRVKRAGYGVYALTDNINEIVEHLRTTYEFWPLFDGAIISSEVQLLKPQAEIYQTLLSKYQLNPEETVFLDDMPYNVEGAQAVGMAAIQFENAQQCELELKAMGVNF
ncbi:HAD family phosphatase [Vibrio alginolyticus]|nr:MULTISPECIES: HAD family phosphatase [Vibrio]EGQ9573793.1 HAD family phosphatase [Vibrio alginolyticus]EGR2354993.1 HAD family phosphatase [Vibrio alginolyticus]EIL8370227.1 HAD family phosphatase [Vibrio alginolyticus]ELA6790526.1 HAD family phosphatase [Vibrio alginolyticus]ELA8261589.1 HAD family phosphatase [Vibrio alginolyticus]